jgi:cytochrome P450
VSVVASSSVNIIRSFPGPRGLPIFGSGLEFWRNPLQFLENVSEQFGDIVRYRLGPREAILFRHPEHVKTVLLTQQHCFIKGGAALWFKSFAGQGLFTSEGAYHARQRRLSQPAFKQQSMKAYAPVMVDEAMRLRERWHDGCVMNMSSEMTSLAMRIVSKAVFNVSVEEETSEVGEALTTIMHLFRDFASARRFLRLVTPWSRWRFEKARRRLDATIYRMINERRVDAARRQDLLSRLICATDEDGQRMADEQLRDEVVTIFIAGHETSANGLAWTWYLLTQHPEIERRLNSEIDHVLGNRPPTVEDLPKLQYVERVVSESLRLYPPLWIIGRRAIVDVMIDDYRIPSGTLVLLSPYLTQRDQRFFENPARFDPDRWTPELKNSRPSFSFFPFGGGGRRCMGEPFAWIEGVLVVAAIAQKWKMRLVPDQVVQAQPLATLRPKYGLHMTLERRN